MAYVLRLKEPAGGKETHTHTDRAPDDTARVRSLGRAETKQEAEGQKQRLLYFRSANSTFLGSPLSKPARTLIFFDRCLLAVTEITAQLCLVQCLAPS